MSLRAIILLFAIVAILPCTVLQNSSATAEELFKNEDVLKMVAAGLSEEVIIAKVREAPQVDFRLSVDDLVALRKAGVSDRVVSAMLERSKPAVRRPAPPVAAEQSGVSLKTSDVMLPLRMVTGDVSSAGFGWTSNTFMNYPGLKSLVRTNDRRPVLLVACPSSPQVGHYFIAKLKRDKGREVRSLKIGQAIRKVGTPGGRLAPDSDWVLPFDITEEGSGIWRVTLKSDLEPGEYGWYINLPDIDHPGTTSADCFQGGGIFDFGID